MKHKTRISIGIAAVCLFGLGINVKANNEQSMNKPFMENSRLIVQQATTLKSQIQFETSSPVVAPSNNQFQDTENGRNQNQLDQTCTMNHQNCDGTHQRLHQNQSNKTCAMNHSNCDSTHKQLHRNGHNGNHHNH